MKTYFKTCLWSPIWLPIVIGLLGLVLHAIARDLFDVLPNWLGAVGFIVVYSIVFGGIQYLITVVFLWAQIDFDDPRSWIKWILILPIIFTLVQVSTMLLIFGFGFRGLNDFASLGILALIDLALGYAYVAVWLLGYGCIRLTQRRAAA